MNDTYTDEQLTQYCALIMGYSTSSPVYQGRPYSDDYRTGAVFTRYDPLHDSHHALELVERLGLEITKPDWSGGMWQVNYGDTMSTTAHSLKRAITECAAKVYVKRIKFSNDTD